MFLEVENLNKSFGDKQILKDVSINVEKGEVIAIIGKSGCGKSTFLRCINGLEKIQSGTIKLDGQVIIKDYKDQKHWRDVRQKVGMVFQSYDLFPHMKVIDNIILGPVKVEKREKEEAIEEARKLLDRVGLLDKENAYPRQLSGGQKQRIAICRALCMNPELLMLDEVTAALDPEMVREVLDVLKGLSDSGLTMLMVTHEMSFARAVADRVVFFNDGIIAEILPPEEFFTNPKTDEAKKFLNLLERD